MVKCCAPHAIAPTPPMIRIGLDALLELLAVTATPIRAAAVPMLVTTAARKLFVL